MRCVACIGGKHGDRGDAVPPRSPRVVVARVAQHFRARSLSLSIAIASQFLFVYNFIYYM